MVSANSWFRFRHLYEPFPVQAVAVPGGVAITYVELKR